MFLSFGCNEKKPFWIRAKKQFSAIKFGFYYFTKSNHRRQRRTSTDLNGMDDAGDYYCIPAIESVNSQKTIKCQNMQANVNRTFYVYGTCDAGSIGFLRKLFISLPQSNLSILAVSRAYRLDGLRLRVPKVDENGPYLQYAPCMGAQLYPVVYVKSLLLVFRKTVACVPSPCIVVNSKLLRFF